MIHARYFFFLFLLVSPFFLSAQEEHVDPIISDILSLKQEVLKDTKEDDVLFLSFWDFDGTILHGDCSEGLYEEKNQIYKGFAQLAIEAGHCKIYNQGDYLDFEKDYRSFEEEIGEWFAYPFLVQMLHGAKEEDLKILTKEHFKNTLQAYYFDASIKIIHALEKNAIQTYIVSASADIFVDAAASTLGLPQERFHGIKVRTKEGKLTYEIEYPITWAEGKTEKIKELVLELEKRYPNKRIVILAAFGNSYNTDGDFMRYIKEITPQKSIAVMINGGKIPPKYQGVFQTVTQKKLFRP